MSGENEITKTLGGIHDIASPRRRRFLQFALIAVVILILVVMIVAPFNKKNANPMQFITAPVTRGDLTVTVTATGTLAPVNQVDVGSEISGTIESVAVDFNDRVKRGQVLARLNTDELDARAVQSRAGLQAAEARVQEVVATVLETRLKLQRCAQLATKTLCTQQDLETANAAYIRAQAAEAGARAQVAQARATLDADETRLKKTVIRSPIDGVVLKRQIEPGQTVAASLQTPVLFTLAENLAQMELRVAVDEADVGKVKEGQRATFTVDAYPQRVFPARITEVHQAPQTIEGVVTYETILSVDNKGLALRPGMTATADIIISQTKDIVLIPNAALRFSPPSTENKSAGDDGGLLGKLMPRMSRRPPQGSRTEATGNGAQQTVWSLRDNKPVAIPVTLGATNGQFTRLVSGELQPGQPLLVDTANAAK